MYGAFIGDIVGSKYEFANIKTKDFPLFSKGCDYTDDTIMTVAVAKAIMLSREEQYKHNENGRGFQEILVEVMQDFGKRYPHPTGAYGGKFSLWLRQKDPKPYESYGNGSAMRVSPCGLAAVNMEEAVALARASAAVSHNHPEGVKGAEAVAVAIFLAKCGKTKEEIRQHISEHYYKLDFTLDSIRDTYRFDGSCQGSVPQAIVAFLESESFEDAIRNVISIGGDCDTTGAIAGSIAWVYYAVQTGWYTGWVYNEFDPAMLEIKKQAMTYLPEEFIQIADDFHEVCWHRAGTNERMGGCTSILNRQEFKKYYLHNNQSKSVKTSDHPISKEVEENVKNFCRKYVALMEILYRDKELNQWCRHSKAGYASPETHCELEHFLYDRFMQEAYNIGFIQKVLPTKKAASYSLEAALAGDKWDMLYGIAMEIRSDYVSNGSLIRYAIGDGHLYRLMTAYLAEDTPQYTLGYIAAREEIRFGRELPWPSYFTPCERGPGSYDAWHDKSAGKWRMQIQLDKEKIWFLTVFLHEDGSFDTYSLDKEQASDSHYNFKEEQKIRTALYQPGDEKLRFHTILMRYVQSHGGDTLLKLIYPYVTAQYHYD